MSLTSLNSTFYLGQNTDVLLARIDPVQHYLQFGAREGRNPSQAFNTNYYLLNNPDVRAAGVNPLQHFEQFGINEGRAPTSAGKFDATAYLAANTDVAGAVGTGKAFASAFEHYAKFGVNENRPGTPTSGNQSGQTFTLNTTADVFNGTSGTDVVRGVAGAGVGSQDQSTLNSSDVLDGGAGVDSLVLLLSGNYGGGATIKNFETLQIGTNLAAASFDYNVNAGAFEVTGVTKILADQINTGEALTINNITKSAGTTGDIPTLAWVNEANSLAGTTAYNFRTSATDGADTKVTVDLTNVRGGTLTLGSGVETIQVNSNGTGNSVQRIDSTGQTATAVTLVAAANAPIGAGFVVSTAAATKGLEEARTPTITNTDHLSFVEVGQNVVKVDASTSTAAVNVQFIDDGTGTRAAKDNTFTGGAGDDRAIVALGNDSLAGGAGNDTIIFQASTASSNGSVFNNSDTIDGGAGTDTLIFGNPTGRTTGITFGLSEFQNSKGVDAIDLRGQTNKITLDDGFIGRADAASFEVMTNRIVQNDSTSSVSDEGTSRHLLDATSVSASRALKISGGEGRESVVVTDALNGIMTVSGGNGLDALIVRNAATLTGQDLANVSGVNVMNLVKTGGAQTFNIDLNAAFVTRQIDTNATNVTAAATANVFQIVTDTKDTNNVALDGIQAIGAGDTVNITVDKSGLATGAINLNDILFSGATVTVKLSDNTEVLKASNGVITTPGTSIFTGASATSNIDFITTPAAGVGAAVSSANNSAGTGTGSTATGSSLTLTAANSILTATASANVSPAGTFLTSSNDTITGAANLSGAFIQDGSTTDSDVATFTLAGGAITQPTLSNIETINLTTNISGASSLAGISGATKINISGGTAKFNEAQSQPLVLTSGYAGALTANVATPGSQGINVTLQGTTTGAAVTTDSTSTSTTTPAIALTVSAASTLSTLDAGNTMARIAVTGTAALTVADATTTGTVNASGMGTGGSITFSDVFSTIITGSSGNDSFTQATAANASIDGGAGNDSFTFGSLLDTNDSINGGAGVDTLSFTDTGLVTSDLANVTGVEVITLGNAATAFNLVQANIASDQTLTIDGTAVASAAITIDASLETDGGRVIITGGGGADSLNGTTAADTLSGGAGVDSLLGGGGADSISAGEGADLVAPGAGADIINLSESTAVADTVVFGNTREVTGGADILFSALSGADTISGFGVANDILMFDQSGFGLADGTEHVGAVGALPVNASAGIVILTGAGYATDAAMEAAVAARVTTDDLDAVIVYFNTTSNQARIVHDTNSNLDGAGATLTLVGVITDITTQAALDTLTATSINSFA